MSSLAKIHRQSPQLTNGFDLSLTVLKYCNTYTELNDPFDQHERFKKQLFEN